MPRTKKLVDLEIKEASGVDHPAHLVEGWLVQKDTALLDEALADVAADPITDETGEREVSELTATLETPVEDEDVEDEPTVETVAVVDEPEPSDDGAEDVVKELADVRKALAEVAAENAVMKDERELEKAAVRTADWLTLPGVDAEFAPVLRSLRSTAPNEAVVIERVLDSCATALSEAGILKEIGSDADADDDAWGQIQALAKSAVDSGRASSLPDAIGIVASENHDLYQRYVTEKREG